MNTRYDRQIRLPEIGNEGQEKLAKSSILCVGAGGLSSPALLYLAAAGIGRIGIIDFDYVDESNLQRQILFTNNDIGVAKVIIAKQKLMALNPQIQIDIYNEEFNIESATKIIPQYDIIIDGTDNFEAKFLINDAAIKFDKPLVYGAIQGFDGQVSVFNYKNGPCYRCLYPEKPKTVIMNCAEYGVIGAVAGIIGITQALQVIQIIIGHQTFEPLSAKLWTIDTRNMQTKLLSFKKRIECKVCNNRKENIILEYNSPTCNIITEISSEQVKNKKESIIIDVREQEEWDCGHIPNARLWPLSKIVDGIMPDVSKTAEIILYCQRGKRSLRAAQILKEKGFTNILSLSGGYESWN